MSNALALLPQGQLPAHLRKDVTTARALGNELAGGVTAGFPIISFRGKVWRIRKSGEERDFLDANDDPIPSIELVFIRSNSQPSKTYYAKKYESGSTEPPTCWSADGVRPDVGVQHPVSALCAACPQNAWGSRTSETGKKGRACADVRRMAVVFTGELTAKGTDAHLFLLRVPPASLSPLKDYAEKVLSPAGVEYFAVATRVGFDTAKEHPQMTFRATRYLTEDEYKAAVAMRETEEVTRILSETVDTELAETGTTVGTEAAARQPQNAPAAPVSAAKPKARPVEEEEVDVDDEPPPPPVVAAAPPPPAAAAKPKPNKPKKAAPVDEDEPPPTAKAAPAGKPPTDFDSILKGLLG